MEDVLMMVREASVIPHQQKNTKTRLKLHQTFQCARQELGNKATGFALSVYELRMPLNGVKPVTAVNTNTMTQPSAATFHLRPFATVIDHNL
jgi:hypothetical protein